MHRIIILAVFTFSIAISAQDQIKDQFCDALKELSKKVKKKKIKEAPHTDVTFKMESFLGNSTHHVNTNYEFIKDYPLFQVDYGNPMAGEKRLIDKYKVLFNAAYIKTSDDDTQKKVKEYVDVLSSTISDCDCIANTNNKPLELVEATGYYNLNWDCKKQGEVILVVDTFELNDDISQFSCYVTFSYNDI